MKIFSAINLDNGKCVRLENTSETDSIYSEDPAKIAETWEALGTDWLHVVNLNGAFSEKEKTAANINALQSILDRVSVPVQFGGGLRSPDDIQEALDMGVSRVVIGSIAVDRPRQMLDILAQFGPERVALGLDIKEGKVASHGWRQLTETDPMKLAQLIHTAGLRHVIYTDITREETLAGANIEAAVALARAGRAAPDGQHRFEVIVSGGIAGPQDIEKLRDVENEGIEGVIVGRALYTGAIDLAQVTQSIRQKN